MSVKYYDKVKAVILISCYAVACIWACYCFGRILYYRHNVFSHFSSFLCCIIPWTIMRVTFWSYWCFSDDAWPDSVEMALYWIPLSVQSAQFSLVISYCKHIVDKSADESYIPILQSSKAERIAFYTFNIGLFLTIIGFVVGVHFAEAPATLKLVERLFNLIAATMFFALCGCFAVYGGKLMQLPLTRGQGPEESRRSIAILCGSLFVLFLTRCVFDLLLGALEDVPSLRLDMVSDDNSHEDKGRVKWACLVCYLIWEVLPTFIMLLLFNPTGSSTSSLHARYMSFLSACDSSSRDASRTKEDLIPAQLCFIHPGDIEGGEHWEVASSQRSGDTAYTFTDGSFHASPALRSQIAAAGYLASKESFHQSFSGMPPRPSLFKLAPCVESVSGESEAAAAAP